LPPGYHQYKFIVDGEWRHDESQPFMPDPLGNVNNWLLVRDSDPNAHPPSAAAAAAASPAATGPSGLTGAAPSLQERGGIGEGGGWVRIWMWTGLR
ncbi:hypothetical protein CLOM_g5526, partial [Closterium sp. NIES-68]